MPTLLWRVLSSMGYPEGREPRYYWDKEPLGDETLVGIEAVVPTSGGYPAWGGWVYESRGVTPFHGASRAAFAVLRDLMERFPQELAHAFAGVFPRGDPYTSVWDQSEVNALERSADEDQHSDSAAMSAMYALMKTYGGLERCLGRLSGSLLTVQDEKRQLQREFDSEVERLQAELARVTRERDQAVQKNSELSQDLLAVREQKDRVTTAHRNCERMLVHVLGQRNEAWHEEDTLRARQLELEQQLANAEEYNENLHEEIHQLHNQLHPHHLPGAAELDSEDEMDADPEIGAAASGDEDEDGSGMDSDHSE